MGRGVVGGRRAVVLVTGMSGAGKSSALTELARRGHAVVDSDDVGWVRQEPTAGGSESLWHLELVRSALQEHRLGWLFVAGCVSNQGELYDLFDAVVLLSAPIDVLLQRVADRTNPFGSTAADRARITADVTHFEAVLRRGADHEIVTTSPLADVVSELERIASSAPSPLP